MLESRKRRTVCSYVKQTSRQQYGREMVGKLRLSQRLRRVTFTLVGYSGGRVKHISLSPIWDNLSIDLIYIHVLTIPQPSKHLWQ